MIPWLIVNVIDAITSRLGYDMSVEWRSDRRWTVEHFWLHRRPPGTPRPAKLGPYRGGQLVAADSLGTIVIGNDVATDRIEFDVADWHRADVGPWTALK